MEPVAANDEDAAAALAKAEVAFSDGHLATARLAATQAVAASGNAPAPLRVRSHIIMGKVELASERFAEAERAFDRALAIDPKNAVARKGKERAHESAARAKPP
jgi:cytochrome c-type biogenesis protein CcmH/NrfG